MELRRQGYENVGANASTAQASGAVKRRHASGAVSGFVPAFYNEQPNPLSESIDQGASEGCAAVIAEMRPQ
jgi:hypothetical protein